MWCAEALDLYQTNDRYLTARQCFLFAPVLCNCFSHQVWTTGGCKYAHMNYKDQGVHGETNSMVTSTMHGHNKGAGDLSQLWVPYLFHTLVRLARCLALLVDLVGDLLQRLLGSFCIQGLLLILPKNGGKEVRQNAAQHQIGISDCRKPILPAGSRNPKPCIVYPFLHVHTLHRILIHTFLCMVIPYTQLLMYSFVACP